MNNKVLMLLTNPFKPDPRAYKEAESLVRGGYHVTIIAWDRECCYPKKENICGINVERVRIKAKYASPLDFILKLPFFYIATFFRILFRDINVVHAHDFDTVPLGILIKWIKRVPLIYDMHEYYPSMIENIVPSIVSKLFIYLDKIFYKLVDKIIIVNDSFNSIIRIPKTIVIMNVPNFKNIIIKRSDEEFVVLQIGGLVESRGTKYIIESFKELPNTKLRLAGNGPLYQYLDIVSNMYNNIDFLGWIDFDQVLYEEKKADVILALYDPNIFNNQIATPNKLFDAMMLKTPIIVSKGTLMEKIVTEIKCGISIEYGNKEQLKQVILWLKDNPKECEYLGERGYEAFKKEYNWDLMEKVLRDVYSDLI